MRTGVDKASEKVGQFDPGDILRCLKKKGCAKPCIPLPRTPSTLTTPRLFPVLTPTS